MKNFNSEAGWKKLVTVKNIVAGKILSRKIVQKMQLGETFFYMKNWGEKHGLCEVLEGKRQIATNLRGAPSLPEKISSKINR